MTTFTRDSLTGLVPAHDALVGVDSDGCVFDTMELKQKRCFHGLIASHWGLTAIEPAVREAAEFVNLYSVWRGCNRFPCLLRTFDLLRDHPGARAARVAIPDARDLRAFVDSGRPLSNAELKLLARETGSAELASLLAWSEAVNARIAQTVRQVPPFPWAAKSLEKIRRHADAICVSQTPTEALVREWEENRLMPLVRVIAGQELGTKAEHLRLASSGRYRPDRVLMVGDAPGDRDAARSVHALFYPIAPGREDDSWRRFHEEAFDLFLAGRYAGAYAADRIAEFNALLPDTPPWKQTPRTNS